MKKISTLLLAAMLLCTVGAFAQVGQMVEGRVVDATGEPIIGANVLETSSGVNGTVTDVNGKFSLSLKSDDAVLTFSYIGYADNVVTVNSRTYFDIILSEDSQAIDDVVVVGYGVQKKKLVTGATSQVSKDDLVSQSSAGLFSSMQSKVTGVTFSAASGQPGSTESIVIRGMGTIGDASPLYVIDGVAGADFSLVSASDIESIDILKDAASAAIYGSRAANGVVLVTTKRGKDGRTNVTYDGYFAIQNVANMVEMCNASEYMELQEEYYTSKGMTLNWSDYIPSYILTDVENGWEGTDWLGEMTNENAPMQSHSIGITGGNDMTKYSIGYTYFDQEGIFGSPVEANFTRHNIRANMDNVIIKNKEWDVLTVNTNIMYSNIKRNGISTGTMWWNDIQNAMTASPLMPVYNSEGGYYDAYDKESEGWTFDIAAYNPIGKMVDNSQNETKSNRLMGNASVNYRPLKNLSIKSSLGYKQTTYFYRNFLPTYNYGDGTTNENEDVTQTAYQNMGYTWENTANYTFDIDTDHAFDIVVGQSIEKSNLGEYLSATNTNMTLTESFDYAWLSNTSGVDTAETSVTGYPYEEYMLSSVFGRVNYNYKEKYLFTAMMRADGSSKFAAGNRWGYFPSVSAGWVLTNEDFMADTANWVDFFKVRASWGQNGNCNIDNFQYLSNISYSESNASFYYGSDKTTYSTGAYSTSMANEDVTWETSEQIDLGIDAYFFNSRLGVVFDAYQKTTKDWLVDADIPGSYGISSSYINGGSVRNRGLELGLSWKDTAGELFYSVSVNASYNKNVVLDLANDSGVINGNTAVMDQNTGYIYRVAEGYSIGHFYGYQTDGIFQNQDQIDETEAVMSGAAPGDLIYVDTNGDGNITDDDKTIIGDPFPDVTGGFNVSLAWRGLDFSVVGKFALGHQIAQSYRRSTATTNYPNWTKYVYENRWHGEGTSNTLPSISNSNNYLYISDVYIHDADYLKIQNITLGYDLKRIWKSAPMKKIRFYASLQNYITITQYNGFDPEVGYKGAEGYSSGIDLGFYPSAKSTVFGVNVAF